MAPFAFDLFSRELSVLVFKVKVQTKLSMQRRVNQFRMCAAAPTAYLRTGYRILTFVDAQSGDQLPAYVQLVCHFRVKDS